ncbi:MAG: HEAT repeat domain-containing protein [Planctomycetota bacterium]|jgi:hypothetical protein
MIRIAACCVVLLAALGCGTQKLPDPDSRDPYERALAVLDYTSSPITGEKVERLLEFLGDPHPLVRDAAMIALSDFGKSEYAARIVPLLRDGHEEVRVRACITLGEMQNANTIPDLAKALRLDASPRVRRRAAYALASFGEQLAVLDPLVDGLKDPDASVRHVSHRMLVDLTGREDLDPGKPEEWKQVLEASGR